jgi:dienelactone hydrolase
MIPDIWGWDSGRTRVIADYFSDNGYYVIVPKLLVPALEGGTDGDGFPPNFDMSTRGGEFGPYMQTVPWDSHMKPRISAILDHLASNGINKVAMSGYCFGGYVCAKANVDFPDKVAIITIPHPSITLEDRVYGGSSLELCKKVTCPVLLLPAGNDPDVYRPQGELYETLKSNNAATETIDFPNMTHGWVPRGDLSQDGVSDGVQKAIDAMLAYYAKNFIV